MRSQIFLLIVAVIVSIFLTLIKLNYLSYKSHIFIYSYNLKNELGYLFENGISSQRIAEFLQEFQKYLSSNEYNIDYVCVASEDLVNNGLNDCSSLSIGIKTNTNDIIAMYPDICKLPTNRYIYVFPKFFCICYKIYNDREEIYDYYCNTNAV